MSKSSNLIEIEDLTVSYRQGEPVLDQVSCVVEPLSYVGVIGPNGGGKTTFLKVILGLLKPDSGRIRVFGEKPGKEVSRLGYVPQFAQFDCSYPISVMDVVLMGRINRSFWRFSYNHNDVLVAQNALERVSLLDKQEETIGCLSGGEVQRVLLARALACEPELLLLDEPTSSIDSRIEQDFYQLLKELNQDMAIMLVSHDVGVIAREVNAITCVNRTLTMHDATTITRENLTDLYDNPVRCVDHHCQM